MFAISPRKSGAREKKGHAALNFVQLKIVVRNFCKLRQMPQQARLQRLVAMDWN